MLYFNNRYGNLENSHQMNHLMYNSNDSYTSKGPSVNLNISYQNYIVEDKLASQKKKYGSDLLDQIREKELKKKLQLQRKKEEDMKEDLRIRKENEKYNLPRRSYDYNKLSKEQLKQDEDELNKKNQQTIKQIPLFRSYLNAESLNPFMEIINAKKIDQDKYTNEMIDKMNAMYDGYNMKINEVNDQIKNIRLLNFHSNLYKVDLVKELSEMRSLLASKRHQENFKRDHIYKAFMNSKRKKQEMNEYFAINQSKLPIINLSNHINCPGMRLSNEWYHKDNLDYKENKPSVNALNESLLKSHLKLDRLNRYEKEYIF